MDMMKFSALATFCSCLNEKTFKLESKYCLSIVVYTTYMSIPQVYLVSPVGRNLGLLRIPPKIRLCSPFKLAGTLSVTLC